MALHPTLFTNEQESLPIRQGFGEGLLEAGKKDTRIVALSADLTESTKMNLFKDAFPLRFVEIGVAEQNLASVASGMAHMGKLPVISSYAMFSPGRNWEQIRTTICYNDVPVLIAGSHAGVSVGPDGGTHQAIEDIALMRVLPNMRVIVPCDAIEAHKATLAVCADPAPTYIRLAREKTPLITHPDTPFVIGRASVLVAHAQPVVTLCATGALVYQALQAQKLLQEQGVLVDVLHFACIKPFDSATLIAHVAKTKRVVTVEEHQVAGGFGSLVAETLAQECPARVHFVGVRDLFGQSGTPEELLAHYGLTKEAIMSAVHNMLSPL